MPGLRRVVSLAAALGLGLALGACSTMADIGEATTDGVTTAANAMNPFNWFDDSSEEQNETAAGADQQPDATAPKTGPESAPGDALAQRDAAAEEARYPKLSDMPDRPREATSKTADQARKELREGLVADKQNAQYTDNELRAQTGAITGTRKADSVRSNERLAAAPPVTPAPTAAVAAPAPTAPTPTDTPPAAPPQAATEPSPAPQKAAPQPSASRQQSASPSSSTSGQKVAAATPRVVPPAPERTAASQPTSYGARQAAAASAAPVARAAPSTPASAPQNQTARAEPRSRQAPAPDTPRTVLKTVQVATIYFNSGSARLSQNDRQIIEQVAGAARRTGGLLRIIGHSSMANAGEDAERAAMVNYKMSLERANAVANELTRQGIPGNQMQVMAEGAQNPIYAETSATGIAGNRRTEIYLDFYETR